MKDIFLVYKATRNRIIAARKPLFEWCIKKWHHQEREREGGVTQIGDKKWQRGGVRPKKVI